MLMSDVMVMLSRRRFVEHDADKKPAVVASDKLMMRIVCIIWGMESDTTHCTVKKKKKRDPHKHEARHPVSTASAVCFIIATWSLRTGQVTTPDDQDRVLEAILGELKNSSSVLRFTAVREREVHLHT